MEGLQMTFSIVFVSILTIGGLLFSYGAKMAKASGSKDKQIAFMETLGAGVILVFLIFMIFAVGIYAN